MMFFDPRRAKRGPGGVLRRDLQLFLVLLLGIQPPPDVFHEARFGERLVKERFQLRGYGQAVDRAGLLLGDSADGLLLHEPALQRVDRRQAVVLGLERAQVGGYPEQLADEILDVRRQFDNEIGLLFARQRAGVSPGVKQALRQRRVGRLQLLQERLVQASQSFLAVQVLKREPKPEIELIRTGMHLVGSAWKNRSLNSTSGLNSTSRKAGW